jgi:murein DD-endopeptidase MepM/ murein hydrolase activator NlpD
MRRFLILVALAAVALLTVAEPWRPTATIDVPSPVVGAGTPVPVTVRDRGRGLASIDVRLVAGDGTATLLAHEDLPATSWWGSGVHERTLPVRVDTVGVRDGAATIEVWATDHSWLPRLWRRPAATAQITVDLTPPSVTPTSDPLVVTVGGSAFVLYIADADAVRTGIRVGDLVFTGVGGYFADPRLHVAGFTIPPSNPDARPDLFAEDAAGNRRTVRLAVTVQPKAFRHRDLDISDDFLERKVPSLLADNGLPPSPTLIEGYLVINRTLRATTEARLRALCAETLPRRLWEKPFLRLPNAASLSLFGDVRSYRYHGEVVDTETHLGFDLASVRNAPVPAAAAGRVVHAGPLGIYGGTVVLDHGLGLFTLYGHLSQIAVAPGAMVERGEEIGRTGETGLAGGDHLHFSTMLSGVHVDPREWWDGHWMRDHVLDRLEAHPTAPEGSAG